MKKLIIPSICVILACIFLIACEEQTLDPVEAQQTDLENLQFLAKASHRTVEELLANQGTTVIPNPSLPDGLWYYPYPNSLGWTDRARDYLALVDYTGLLNQWLIEQGHPGVGTEISGSVKERLLSDGRVEIQAILHIRNALTWVTGDWSSSWKFGPKIFGNTPMDVLAGDPYALCDAKFSATFITNQPGEVIPDIFQIYFFSQPGQELKKISLIANGSGPLGDGSPGRIHITEVGLFDLGNLEPGEYKWPCGMINAIITND
jgi:hypothetical protein